MQCSKNGAIAYREEDKWKQAVLDFSRDHYYYFKKYIRYKNYVYYFGCCHCFVSNKSKKMKDHDKSTKENFTKVIKENLELWTHYFMADWILQKEIEAEKQHKRLPFISYNSEHYENIIVARSKDGYEGLRESKEAQSAPVEPDEYLGKRYVAPKKFYSETGLSYSLMRRLDRSTSDLNDAAEKIDHLSYEIEDLKKDLRNSEYQYKDLKSTVNELKKVIKELREEITKQ